MLRVACASMPLHVSAIRLRLPPVARTDVPILAAMLPGSPDCRDRAAATAGLHILYAFHPFKSTRARH